MNQPLYKVVPADSWRAAESEGEFHGSGIDLQDGFIHLSAPDQVVETVAKHFAGQHDLLLITVNADKLGSTLRWETSRGGALFPHVYGVISMDAVEKVDPLPLGSDGTHQFPVPDHRDFALPNEVILNPDERIRLKRCVAQLWNGQLADKLNGRAWSITRAEFCETDAFLEEMGYFERRHPFEHKELCESLVGHERVGVFQFQINHPARSKSESPHATSLLVLVSQRDTRPLWYLESELSF